MPKQTKKLITKLVDPTTQYAQDVVGGKIIAGKPVVDACQRHLNDLSRTDIMFDPALAQRFFDFCAETLRLNGGQYEGVPFELIDWQKFVGGSIFGWLRKDGSRRFREVFVLTAKGSGKSPLAAAIGLYMLVADNEPRAHIYAAAATRDQAMIMFRDAVAMVEQSEELFGVCTFLGDKEKRQIDYTASHAFFKPIASDDRGKGHSGVRPHCALLDEVHEHANSTMIELLKAGRKSRKQPLIFCITNTATNRTNPAWDYFEYAGKINTGALTDDQFFGYCCALDPDDDPFNDESCWVKANPSLNYGLPGLDYLRGQVQQSRGLPATEIMTRRLNFCEWTDSAEYFLPSDKLKKVMVHQELEDFKGAEIILGLDLSKRLDLTALAAVAYKPEWTRPRAIVFQYTPKDGLADREMQHKIPYSQWLISARLKATPGAIVDYAAIGEAIAWFEANCRLVTVAYDRLYIEFFKKEMEFLGYEFPYEPFGQGYASMSPATRALEAAVFQETLEIDDCPLLYYNFSCATPLSNPAGDIKLDKSGKGHIDGAIALIMAYGTYVTKQNEDRDTINFLKSMYANKN